MEEHKDHGEHHHTEHKEHKHVEHHKIHHEEHKPEVHKKHVKVKKTDMWKILTLILGVLLVISIFTGGFGLFGSKESAPAQKAQAAQPRQAAPSAQPTPSVDMKDLIDDDEVKGSPNAPVTIVEFSDFECPFCTRFYQQTLPQIEEEYINTGKVKFVYRDFPLGFHANAQKSAEASECAGEQGKFWEMHDKLFEDGVSGGVTSFKQFAQELGLNTAKFNDCLDSGEMASEVTKDMQDGSSAGITGTPGFIINGELVVGAQPYQNFKEVIDAALGE